MIHAHSKLHKPHRPLVASGARFVRNNIGTVAKYGKMAYDAYKSSRKARNDQYKKVKQSLHQGAHQSGNGGSWSHFHYGHRKIRNWDAKLNNTLPPQNWVLNTSTRSIASFNAQGYATVNTMFTVGNLNTMLNQPTAPSPNANTLKFFFKSVAGEMFISNVSTNTTRVTIYDIIVRQDTSSTNVQDPAYAFGHSFADELAGSNADVTITGVTPFQSKSFVDFFKVLKITNVELSSGQTHTHKYKFLLNTAIEGEKISTSSSYGLKGITCYQMIVFHGYPDDSSGATSAVGFGSSALDIAVKQNYVYKFVNQTPVAHRASALSTTITGNEQTINEKTGAVVTVTTS